MTDLVRKIQQVLQGDTLQQELLPYGTITLLFDSYDSDPYDNWPDLPDDVATKVVGLVYDWLEAGPDPAPSGLDDDERIKVELDPVSGQVTVTKQRSTTVWLDDAPVVSQFAELEAHFAELESSEDEYEL